MNVNLAPLRWLVVDDDPLILQLAARTLRSVPRADVVACSRPEDAIAAVLAAPATFELLVTDFNMPGMDGIELARRLKAFVPGLRVLLMTGTPLAEIGHVASVAHTVLAKPFTHGALLAETAILIDRDLLMESRAMSSALGSVQGGETGV